MRRLHEPFDATQRFRAVALCPIRRLGATLAGVRDLRREGFTILEIMIATAILTLGLVGILALFPVAIHTGKDIVDTTTSAVIAESVAEAIREGMRNQVRHFHRGGVTQTYFVFKHDGGKDRIPGRKELERPDHDYYILLPRYRKDARFPNRDVALRIAKTFLYPEYETSHSPNGNGDAFLADDDGDDERILLTGGEMYTDVRVEETYKVGLFLPSQEAPPGEAVLDDQKIETLKQYSFAFAIQASREDVNLSPSKQAFEPGNRLYRVRVMVFRGFMKPGPDAKAPAPAYELDFEVTL